MPETTRRKLLKYALTVGAASLLPGEELKREWEWIRSCRCVIAEAYNPPFYPRLDYRPDKAIKVCQALGANSLRYPAASYYAYFPTKTAYPRHPELRGDLMLETIERCREAGLKVIAYVPLNHPFMEVRANEPRYLDWVKRFADGTPMTTGHYGYATYYEGCLNSPLRDVIRAMVREVLRYGVDVMYFDGPYMGMKHSHDYCHCKYCVAAYQKARGKSVPKQDAATPTEDTIEYHRWMADDVAIAFLREMRQLIREERDTPVLFNDTSLLRRQEWRNRAIPEADGFMFEAAETPEHKLFNLSLGHSTGKVIWTYLGTHTQYNREHLKNEDVRAWFSYPVESEELLLDGATAVAAHAGLKYWGLSRFFYQMGSPLDSAAGRYVRESFDLARNHREVLFEAKEPRLAGLLVGSQTVDWYGGELFVNAAYQNYYHGAFQLLKELSYDTEPFLDYRMTAESLSGYKLIYVPHAPCLSDTQCEALRQWVNAGGVLVATHLTSTCDEFGRPRKDFGLADVFGAHYEGAVEIPDLYLRWAGGGETPQDSQVVKFRAENQASVIAETIERGQHSRVFGPAVVSRAFGRGWVFYIGSGLEAVYEETRIAVVRDALARLLEQPVGRWRNYRVPPRPGLMAHFTLSGKNHLLLHLLANTGNKSKKFRQREEFLPLEQVKAALRVPAGRRVAKVTLLKSGAVLDHSEENGWVEVTVPRVRIYEAIHVELG